MSDQNPRRPFLAGDLVRLPTGEKVVLAADENLGAVYWCGWPDGSARADMVELLKPTDELTRRHQLRETATEERANPTTRSWLAAQQLRDIERTDSQAVAFTPPVAATFAGDRQAADPPDDRMLKWFAAAHLPRNDLRELSMRFRDLAYQVCAELEPGPERTVALRKLLEAKDCAVRALVHPGG